MESMIQIKRGSRMVEGIVTYEEGDLIEALFSDETEVTVGDQLRCLLTADYETISTFEAVVVAREKNKLFLFHSPTATEFREQRRRYPRFDMAIKGWLQYQTQEPASLLSLSNQMVELVNLSLGGMAFRTEKELPIDQPLFFTAELYGRNRPDGVIKVELQAIHTRLVGTYHHYGCTIKGISARHFHNLRKYILHRQLQERRGMPIE